MAARSLLLPDRVQLAVRILHEVSQNQHGEWEAYLKTLPTSYALLGSFPCGIELELQAPHAVAACQRAQAQLGADYAAAKPLMAALPLPARLSTPAAWRFAAGAVATRAMHLDGDSAGCLTPFADMHNYCPPPAPVPPALPVDSPRATAAECADTGGANGGATFCAEEREYRIISRRPCQPGEQLFLCYGCYTNLSLLEHYGFLLPGNPHDEVLVPLRYWPLEAALVEAPENLFLHADGRPSWHLLLHLRLHFVRQHEQRQGKGPRGAPSSSPSPSRSLAARQGLPLEAALEAAVFQSIADACLQVLQSFASSTKADEALLQQLLESTAGPRGKTLRNECHELSIRWRMQYKRSVALGHQVARKCLAALSASSNSPGGEDDRSHGC